MLKSKQPTPSFPLLYSEYIHSKIKIIRPPCTTVMASTTEQPPPKKRRPSQTPPPPSPPPTPPPPPPGTQTPTNTPIPQALNLTPDEIAQKRRNQEEIRNFYESFKQLKYCVSRKKDFNHVLPELEQAYLSLITASRGCASVQRLVALFVPKYASHCPTALEAAAKVCINIHNWSMTIVNKGEDDAENFAFGTAKICIFGLATICEAASLQTPSSSVIQGICLEVFLNVMNFFISSLGGQEIFQVVNKDVVNIYDCPNTFNELKEKYSVEDEAPSVKLSKCRALCLLWIFFRCPKSTLEACVELCSSNSADAGSNVGQHFLNQVTARLGTCEGQVSIDNSLSEDVSHWSKSCLLDLVRTCATIATVAGHVGLVLNKDPSLRQWIFLTVRSVSKSASPNVISAISAAFNRIFSSFTEQVRALDKQVDNNMNDSSTSKIQRQFSVPRTPSDAVDQLNVLQLERDIRSNTSPNNSGGPQSMELDSVDHRDLSRASSSMPNIIRASSSTPNKESHASRLGNGVPALNVSIGGVKCNFESPKHHFPFWHSDGDRAAMDVFSASRHLWVGSLGPEASEHLVRYQFERFGPINKFLYLSIKGFAVIEYKHIMDSIKAREVMRGHSPWGACLIIKFLDTGLGTRGDINGVAVGTCCDVYVGNIRSQSDKDEILYESRQVIFKGPLAVSDLVSEGAVLMEFGNPEEAATVTAHLRQRRKEKRDFFQSPGVGHLHVDSRNNNLGNCIASSPLAQTVVGYSQYGNPNPMELTSPRVNIVNQGATMQSGYPFQAGGHIALGAPEQNWTYSNPESVPHSTPMHGHNYASSQPIQPFPYMRPMYYPPNSSWDAHGMDHHMPLNPHNHAVAPPFLPASVTPLAQIQANPMPHHDPMFYVPPQPHIAPPVPPQLNMPLPLPSHPGLPPPSFHPELPPPLPPSPPPSMLESQPPPPPPPLESSIVGGGGQWQGTLSKSGVHYSTIHARRLQSEACNYTDNNISEPAEWPAKLDITKRTDFKHVMSTFSGTPSHKKEVCQLLPTSPGNHKGFQDFISYLKQRECAGVIKIPATKTTWARLLFILPYSNETCSLLSVAPDTVDCLIGLVLPKETNFEWV